MIRFALLSLPFLVCLLQVTRSVEIQTISEAQSALTRQIRAAEPSPPHDSTQGVQLNTNCLRLTASKFLVRVYEPSNVVLLDDDMTAATMTATDRECELNAVNGTAVVDVSLGAAGAYNVTELRYTMNFYARNQMWYLANIVIQSLKANARNGSSAGQTIEIKDLRLETPDAYAGLRNSFYCDEQEPMRASRETTQNTTSNAAFAYLWFEDLHLQPFRNATFGNDTNQNMTDGWSHPEPCNRAYTIGLLMATFTAFVMAAILALGIGMLTSVKTMDRFDDPKTSKLLSVPSE